MQLPTRLQFTQDEMTKISENCQVPMAKAHQVRSQLYRADFANGELVGKEHNVKAEPAQQPIRCKAGNRRRLPIGTKQDMVQNLLASCRLAGCTL